MPSRLDPKLAEDEKEEPQISASETTTVNEPDGALAAVAVTASSPPFTDSRHRQQQQQQQQQHQQQQQEQQEQQEEKHAGAVAGAVTVDNREVPPPSSDNDNDNVPDGGLAAWLQVSGAWVVMAVTWGLSNSFGVYQTYYESEMLAANSPSQISWVGSLQSALLMILAPVSGALFDAGYCRETLWAGLLLVCLGQFMTSVCSTYWQVVLAQGVCVGLGNGLAYVPATAALSQFFRRRRSLAIGVAATGSPIATMIFPVIFGRLQPQIGFGWATRVIAFIVLGLCVFPAAFLRPRLPPSGRVRSVVDMSALREAPFVLATAAAAATSLGMYVAFFYIQVFALQYAIGPADFSPYYVTLLSAGSIAGRLGPTYLADKIGPLNMVVAVTYACAAIAFGWLGVRDLAGLVVFALLYGCFTGSVVSMLPSLVVSLSSDQARVGTRMGMMFCTAGVATLIGTPVAGLILGDKSDHRWTGAISYSGATLLGSAVIFTLARAARYRTYRT